MSDTVAVALIAVAGTLGSGGLSYVAARRNTEVQLASVNVELQRLQASQATEGRNERRELYHQFLDAASDLEELARGFRGDVTQENYLSSITAFGRSFTNILLLGEEGVVERAEELNQASADLAEVVVQEIEKQDGRALSVILNEAFNQTRKDWIAARNRTVEAIRADIGATGTDSSAVAPAISK